MQKITLVWSSIFTLEHSSSTFTSVMNSGFKMAAELDVPYRCVPYPCAHNSGSVRHPLTHRRDVTILFLPRWSLIHIHAPPLDSGGSLQYCRQIMLNVSLKHFAKLPGAHREGRDTRLHKIYSGFFLLFNFIFLNFFFLVVWPLNGLVCSHPHMSVTSKKHPSLG